MTDINTAAQALAGDCRMTYGPDWCYSHMRDEPMTPGAPVCGECFHAWTSDAELVRDFTALAERIGLHIPSTVDEIRSCPFCTHDF